MDLIQLLNANLYGPGDNYHATNSHVVPSLIKRFYDAKNLNRREVVCWGAELLEENYYMWMILKQYFLLLSTGTQALKCPFNKKRIALIHLNVGTGVDITIKKLAGKIAKTIGYEGEIIWG